MYNKRSDYDVIIIGGGSSGVGAAYALKNKGYKVALVEQAEKLGGTACNSWVETWIQALVPPHIEEIFNQLPNEKKIGKVDNAWLRPVFSSQPTCCLFMERNALSGKYEKDLKQSGIDLFTKYRFVSATEYEKRITNVSVRNLETDEIIKLSANFFIDASADGVLCRSVGSEYFLGRDEKSMYNESIAPEKKPKEIYLNEPSLFFKIAQGVDDREILSSCRTVREENGKIINEVGVNLDGYSDINWVNPMSGCGNSFGDDNKTPPWLAVINEGVEKTQKKYEERIVEYWKYVKLRLKLLKPGEKTGAWNLEHLNYGFSGDFATYLGVRETYRIKCDYMFRQNDLMTLICSKNIENFIASGSHAVDFHITTGLDTVKLEEFKKEKDSCGNPKLPLFRPYGIPYQSTVPVGLNNVLVASRCFGASQIALASARVNMVMAQLGWAVGNALCLCLDKNLENVRAVNDNIAVLQSDDYTQFATRVKKLESKYNDLLQKEIIQKYG